MAIQGGGGRFSALLLEGLDHYRKGHMLEAVRAWEEAYLLEPTNLRAREFLRSALERIHAVMSPANRAAAPAAAPHPWLPSQPPAPTSPPPQKSAPAPSAAPAKKPASTPRPVAASKPGAVQPAKASRPPPAGNPWDDGPSLAIPQPEMTGEGGNAAWSIHKDAPQQQAAPDD